MKFNSGLCCNCHHGSNCIYQDSIGRPVHQCEEFYQLPAPNGFCGVAETVELGDPQEKEIFAGLCFNCNHRHDCTLRLANGNVWHCEEYE